MARRRTHPRIRGGRGVRLAALALGVFLFASGVVLILESKLGLAPWDVLHQGITRHTPLSFGAANVVVAMGAIVLGRALGGRIGLGTLANGFGVGGFVQVLTSIGGVGSLAHWPLASRIGLLASGIMLIGVGTAFYVGADFAAGPRDTLMLVASKRTGVRIGVTRGLIELAALVAGIVLGGHFGVGTFAFAFGVGASVEVSFALLSLTPLATRAPTETLVVVGE